MHFSKYWAHDTCFGQNVQPRMRWICYNFVFKDNQILNPAVVHQVRIYYFYASTQLHIVTLSVFTVFVPVPSYILWLCQYLQFLCQYPVTYCDSVSIYSFCASTQLHIVTLSVFTVSVPVPSYILWLSVFTVSVPVPSYIFDCQYLQFLC
jgi:hypothetical protein